MDKSKNSQNLDHAIRTLKSEIVQDSNVFRFSPERRAELVSQAFSEFQTPKATFSWRIPALVATALFVGVISMQLTPETSRHPAGAHSVPRIEVSKVANRVVFDVRNGADDHTVMKSSNPDAFDSGSARKISDGSFDDPLDRGPNIVFYRVD